MKHKRGRMPKFSQESFSKLSTCHLDLQAVFFEVIHTIDCTILEGHRNQQDQDKAYADGKSKLQWPHGKHNSTPSLAVDVAPYPVNFKDTQRFFYFAGFVKGVAEGLKIQGKITHNIRWGGDWNSDNKFDDNKFNDFVHFELIE